mgnify:CR=1 FL=1
MDCFDWRLFNTVCGIDAGSVQFRDEAVTMLRNECLAVSYTVHFVRCARRGDDIVSTDGELLLPMLRQSGGDCYSLADYFPSESSGVSSMLCLEK